MGATTTPRLLDLCCGAGGAARGYQRAGFYVVGVDVQPQPRYAGDEFHQADALTFPLHGFDAIHASPPCQAFSALARATGKAGAHPNLIPALRARLHAHATAAGVPWVIENVPGAPLRNPLALCGASFGLEVVRHRWFEPNVAMLAPPCGHVRGGTKTGQYVAFRHSTVQPPGRRVPLRMAESEFRRALGVDWMTTKEAREAIPPAYTEYIGGLLLAAIATAGEVA